MQPAPRVNGTVAVAIVKGAVIGIAYVPDRSATSAAVRRADNDAGDDVPGSRSRRLLSYCLSKAARRFRLRASLVSAQRCC